MTATRLEVDIAFNCRPNKGERRAKDGTGRMVKASIYSGPSLADCLGEARRARKASEKHAPGYSEVIAVRAYDKDAFSSDPLKTAPFYEGRAL